MFNQAIGICFCILLKSLNLLPSITLSYVNSPTSVFESTNIANSHQSGVSAHDYQRKTLDYFWNHHGYAGIDGYGKRTISVVNYTNVAGGLDQRNAFYNAALDVGQNAWEEIDIIYPGLNYGWNEMEASYCYPPGSDCNPDEFELPVWEYELYVDNVCSVTGGYVYRGSDIWSLRGKYIYGDINGDSILNVLDIVLVVNFILGSDTPDASEFAAADLNSDGILNILDVVSLTNLILGA